jgi:hypothetical protein
MNEATPLAQSFKNQIDRSSGDCGTERGRSGEPNALALAHKGSGRLVDCEHRVDRLPILVADRCTGQG